MTVEATPEVAALRDLHRVVMLVHSGTHLHEVLDAAAEGVVTALGFEGATINLLTDDDVYVAVTSVGPGSEMLDGTRAHRAEFEAELSVADRWGALRFVPAGRYATPDDVVVFRPDEEPLDVPDAWRPADALYAPLHDQHGEILGILSVDQPVNRRQPSLLKRQCLEMYAVQIGLAIAHARDRERLERRVRLAAALRAVVHTAGGASDLEAVLDESIVPLKSGFAAPVAWIRLFADEAAGWEAVNFPRDLATTLHVTASGAFPPVDEDRVFAAGERLAHRCWRGPRTVVVSQAGDTSHGLVAPSSRARILDWLEAVGLDTFIMIPVGTARECSGYVVLARPAAAGSWKTTEAEAALEIGRELGRAIGIARGRQRELALMRRLEQLDAHKNEMIATVVHELKNPLSSIRGNLELVQEDPEIADRVHETIAFNVDRMLGLVQNMLTLSHLRDPSTELHAEPVDLTAMVESLPPLLEIQAHRSGVGLVLDDIATGAVVSGDREQLERMMLNLTSNAIKFSESGATVSISLHRQGDGVEFVCRDRGIGISPADQQHLFEEFHRSTNPQARARPGTGLGLAIVAKIVERHRGTVRVESRLGEGTTFVIRLPVG